MVELKIQDLEITADLDISAEVSEELSVSGGKEVYKEYVGTQDYEKLENLPSLDGRTIIKNINEQDPTVQVITLKELADLF